MNEFVEVKTAELTGAALDWAVAMAVGAELRIMRNHDDTELATHPLTLMKMKQGESGVEIDHWWSPSTDWAQGGPLLDKYNVALNGGVAESERVIYATCRDVAEEQPYATAIGDTRLTAACRAIVSAKLGDVVQVPKVLLESKNGD